MIKDEFRSKSYQDPKTGCWLWHGKAPRGPTRKSYEAFKGPITKGQWVLHKCDVPKCINPKHLFLGDRSINMIDMYSKGRGTAIVANRVNKTHCIKGHPFNAENTIYRNSKRPGRDCKICRLAATRKSRKKRTG